MDFCPKKNAVFENFLIALTCRLKNEGIESHFIFSGTPDGRFSEAIEGKAGYSAVPWRGGLFNAVHTARIALRYRPRVIGYWFIPLFSSCCQISARLPFVKRTIFLDHDSSSATIKAGFRKVLGKLRATICMQPIDEVVSVSYYNQARNVRRLFVPPSKNRVIYNGVVPKQSNPISSAVPYFFYAGQIEKYKGVHTLATAFSDFLKDSPSTDIELWFAGKGSAEDEIRSIACASTLPERFKLLGLRNDVPSLMAGSIANIVPSEWAEACGLTAIEGMASGKPLIVSDAGALPEMVGDVALVFERGDSKQLTEMLALTVSNSYQGMAVRASERVKELFLFDRMLDEYTKLFLAATH